MIECFKLNNGVDIPSIGFGSYLAPEGEVAIDSVESALRDGYRLVDTAAAYNNEASVGIAIVQSRLPRKDIFVTSKVWNTDRGYDAAMRAFDKSLAALGLDYLDLYLIHWPASQNQYSNWRELNNSTWRALEAIYNEGRARSIGVSNFLPHHLAPLIDSATVLPMVNQIEFHPGFMQRDCVDYCRAHKIVVEAWSPLGRGRVLSNETLLSVADKYSKSVAQICLRWAWQHEVITLPKSVNPKRIKENIDIFDFAISDDDMRLIDNLGEFGESGLDPDKIDF